MRKQTPFVMNTVKPLLSGHSKRIPEIDFQDRLSLNAGQKYCRMLQGEHPVILSTFIKLSFAFKTFVLSIFEWPLMTGFIVVGKRLTYCVLSISNSSSNCSSSVDFCSFNFTSV